MNEKDLKQAYKQIPRIDLTDEDDFKLEDLLDGS